MPLSRTLIVSPITNGFCWLLQGGKPTYYDVLPFNNLDIIECTQDPVPINALLKNNNIRLHCDTDRRQLNTTIQGERDMQFITN